jgi:hypothetical protein
LESARWTLAGGNNSLTSAASDNPATAGAPQPKTACSLSSGDNGYSNTEKHNAGIQNEERYKVTLARTWASEESEQHADADSCEQARRDQQRWRRSTTVSGQSLL